MTRWLMFRFDRGASEGAKADFVGSYDNGGDLYAAFAEIEGKAGDDSKQVVQVYSVEKDTWTEFS